MEMVDALNNDDDDKNEEAKETIWNDPLNVEVRSGWYSPGSEGPAVQPTEFRILLCWGGPACRIIGDLDNGQPEKPRLEYQDWGTPWTEYSLTEEEEEALLVYCQQFYFE